MAHMVVVARGPVAPQATRKSRGGRDYSIVCWLSATHLQQAHHTRTSRRKSVNRPGLIARGAS